MTDGATTLIDWLVGWSLAPTLADFQLYRGAYCDYEKRNIFDVK